MLARGTEVHPRSHHTGKQSSRNWGRTLLAHLEALRQSTGTSSSLPSPNSTVKTDGKSEPFTPTIAPGFPVCSPLMTSTSSPYENEVISAIDRSLFQFWSSSRISESNRDLDHLTAGYAVTCPQRLDFQSRPYAPMLPTRE